MPFLVHKCTAFAEAKKIKNKYVREGYRTNITREDRVYEIWVIDIKKENRQNNNTSVKPQQIPRLDYAAYTRLFLLENPEFLEI